MKNQLQVGTRFIIQFCTQLCDQAVQQCNIRWRTFAVVLSVLASISFTTNALAQATLSDPDCQCRAPDGQMRDLGTVECVEIVGTKKMVSCVMSTNTPYWKTVKGVDGCPDA